MIISTEVSVLSSIQRTVSGELVTVHVQKRGWLCGADGDAVTTVTNTEEPRPGCQIEQRHAR